MRRILRSSALKHFTESLSKIHKVFNLCSAGCECTIVQLFLCYTASVCSAACILTRLVKHKVFIDYKGSLYWAILVYLVLNLLLIRQHAVRRFTCNTLRVRILHLC